MRRKETQNLFNILSVFIVLVSLIGFTSSCHKNNSKEPEAEQVDRLTFIYAVNISSLSVDFMDDRKEMLQGVEAYGGNNSKLLLYCSPNKNESVIYEAKKINDTWDWKELKKYNRNVTSTDPERMHKVITDAISYYPTASKTLIFWGHGSSWTPSFTDHETRAMSGIGSTEGNISEGYGGEYGSNDKTKWIEIDQLADAVPDGAFDTIWFDCCYMSAAEVAYQLRNKCRWFVAYPTEVWGYGLNYDDVLPYIMKPTPALIDAAKCFFDYYQRSNLPVTVSVMDMDKIEPMAQACKKIIKEYPGIISVNNVVNYGRRGYYYYDLFQLMHVRCSGNTQMMTQLREALDEFIVYHAESSVNFDRQPWKALPLCGISIDNYVGGDSKEAEYYRTLAWYSHVYE